LPTSRATPLRHTYEEGTTVKGFSWKRALGVTRAKQKFARMTGIPTTKRGRQQKIGRLVTGGGCLLPVVVAVVLALTVAAFVVA
jgi:hypothetical protein